MQNNLFSVIGTPRPDRALDALTCEMQDLVQTLQIEPSDAQAQSLMTLVADYRLTLKHKAHALQQCVAIFPLARERGASILSATQANAQQQSLMHGTITVAPDRGFEEVGASV